MLLTRSCLLKVLLIPLTLILIIVTNTTTAQASIRSSLLIHYSATGNAFMVRSLLRVGADPNFVSERYDMESISSSRLRNKHVTALVAAIKKDHFHIVDILLEAGADPSIPDLAKNTALAVAAAHSDNTKLIQKLLDKLDELGKKKDEIDTPDSRGTTPLMQAITNNHVDVSQLLINEGANINTEDQLGNTPLLLAVRQSIQIIEMLLQKGVDINCRKNARECPIIQASRSRNREIIRILLDADADIDAKNEFSQTALTVAIGNGDTNTAEMLLEEGADPNIGKPRPIIQAASIRNKRLIDILVKKGIDLNALDEQNNTALLVALQKGYQDIAHQLLQAEANPNVRNKSGEIPLILALEREYLDMSLPHKLLEKGANPNVRNASGEPALIIATKKRYLEVLIELLEHENIDVNAQNTDGDTAIIVASREGHLDAVHRLLEKGANPDIPNQASEIPLILALEKNHLKVFDKLLKHKSIDVNAQNADGDTPLIVAFREGHLDAVYRLLEKGANPNIANQAGETVLRMIIYSKDNIYNPLPRLFDSSKGRHILHNPPPHLFDLFQTLLLHIEMDSTVTLGEFGEVTVSIEKCADALSLKYVVNLN